MSDHFIYPAVVTQVDEADGGGYLAYAPDLKGCIADGDTPEGAVAHLREAIAEWLDEARRLGRKIPKPGDCAERAQAERKAYSTLIDKQSELLEMSANSFKKLKSEIEAINKRVAALS